MNTTAVPMSAAELRDAMRHGRPYDAARLDRLLYADAKRGVVEVQGATAWRTLAEHLRPGDEAARAITGSLPSVGASIAWNAAGPDGRPTVRHVESLALVTPDGELRRASRAANTELFALVIGGQNLFGALYSVTLRMDSLARAIAEALPVEVSEVGEAPRAVRRVQLLCPPEAVPALLEDCRALCAEWRISIPRTELRATAPEEETYLPWARRAYVQVALSLAAPERLGASVRLAQVCPALIEACLRRGGSFSIAQTSDASREQVEACYPRLRSLLAEKRRFDPGERLLTPWYLHHRSLLSRPGCESRWNA
jgi:hypothetical protein